jgi:Protein of unknown function (DUF3551)
MAYRDRRNLIPVMRKSLLRRVLCRLAGVGGMAVMLLAAAGTAGAEEPYPWCATYGGGANGIGATTCGFDTLEQCRATVSGVGGYCQPNPTYTGPEKKAVKQSRKRHQGY